MLVFMWLWHRLLQLCRFPAVLCNPRAVGFFLHFFFPFLEQLNSSLPELPVFSVAHWTLSQRQDERRSAGRHSHHDSQRVGFPPIPRCITQPFCMYSKLFELHKLLAYIPDMPCALYCAVVFFFFFSFTIVIPHIYGYTVLSRLLS